MANRLAGETSPYLLQHADNPVEWYPWSEEALARARSEGKPILLSVGYLLAQSPDVAKAVKPEPFGTLNAALHGWLAGVAPNWKLACHWMYSPARSVYVVFTFTGASSTFAPPLRVAVGTMSTVVSSW